MLPKDVLKQVKRLEIKTTRLVNQVFGGEYESVFKGRGMEFAEVREYVPGDDVRTIDWNVTARSQKPFIKKFTEERELAVILVVDGSASLRFGSEEKFKSTIAAELGAVLAFSAAKNNDKVGLLIYTDRIEKFLPPKKGHGHVLRAIREILYNKPVGKGTNLKKALEHLRQMLSRSAVIFIISDFRDAGYEKALKILNQKHDVIAIRIADPREKEIPAVGWMELEDAETQERALINTSSKAFQDRFQAAAKKSEAKLDYFFRLSGIDHVKIMNGRSYVDPLIRFFRERERRKLR